MSGGGYENVVVDATAPSTTASSSALPPAPTKEATYYVEKVKLDVLRKMLEDGEKTTLDVITKEQIPSEIEKMKTSMKKLMAGIVYLQDKEKVGSTVTVAKPAKPTGEDITINVVFKDKTVQANLRGDMSISIMKETIFRVLNVLPSEGKKLRVFKKEAGETEGTEKLTEFGHFNGKGNIKKHGITLVTGDTVKIA